MSAPDVGAFRFLLFLFGWSGKHAHIFHVYAHAHVYAATYRPGVLNMKRTGRAPPMPAGYPYSQKVWEDANGLKPEYALVPMGRTGGKGEDSMTLGEVWNRKRERNASGGACENREIAVVWTYDFAGE